MILKEYLINHGSSRFEADPSLFKVGLDPTIEPYKVETGPTL